MKRVCVIGASGSGKSTLARQLADKLGARCIDLDELNWRPNWQPAPEAEFIEALQHSMDIPSWVIAGNYSGIQSHFLPQADTIIWLDYPLFLIVYRQTKRTLKRIIRHEPCCNGNFETLRNAFSRDSVLLWLLTTFRRRKRSGWNTKRRARQNKTCFLHFRQPSQ